MLACHRAGRPSVACPPLPECRSRALKCSIVRTKTLGIRVDAIADTQATSLLLDAFGRRGGPPCSRSSNPASLAVARRNPPIGGCLTSSMPYLPDGIGMCWAMRLLHGLPATRVSFDTTSLAPLVFGRARQHALTVALIGGRPGVVQRAADQLTKAFPGIEITATLDGYGDHAGQDRRIEIAVAFGRRLWNGRRRTGAFSCQSGGIRLVGLGLHLRGLPGSTRQRPSLLPRPGSTQPTFAGSID